MSKQKKDAIVKNGQITKTDIETLIASKHKTISGRNTPKPYIDTKGKYDYVEESYMRYILNQYYPIWSWEIIKHEFVGDKYIAVHGRLIISDNGVNRHFESIAAHKLAPSHKKDELYVDIGNDMKSANSDAFKVAVNRLCNVADDVYRKQITDYSLSEEDVDIIKDYIGRLSEIGGNFETETASKMSNALRRGEIDKTNLDASIRKAEMIINSEGDENG